LLAAIVFISPDGSVYGAAIVALLGMTVVPPKLRAVTNMHDTNNELVKWYDGEASRPGGVYVSILGYQRMVV
jgi:hypothetical protein